MSEQMHRQELCRGVALNTVADAKFKSNRISCNILVPLDRENATVNAVVPFILRQRFRACPDFTRLSEKLCELYGASLDGDVRKYGGYQIINLSIQGLDDRFTLDSDPMVKECCELICDMLLDPYLEDGCFAAEDTRIEVQNLIDTIQSEINDKRDYAVAKCVSLMFEGEPFAIKKYGWEEDARAITPASATAAWRDLLRRGIVEILFIGSGSSEQAAEIFRRRFELAGREPIAYSRLATPFQQRPVRRETQAMDVKQGKLVLGFRTGELSTGAEHSAMKVMTALWGGTPFSRLFLNVREKLHLCYYCATRYDRGTGSVLVDSGVEFENREKAEEEIFRQLDAVKNGEFSDEELNNAVLYMVNALKSVTDTLGGMENWYLTQVLSGAGETPMENAEQIRRVTREDVMAAAETLRLDTVYFLTGKGAADDE
ncbi:MAG: insulinase family protein [Oscillospiraceae bacterium]|nr:insulinase family protein [Oscillospiraceae bacterium]